MKSFVLFVLAIALSLPFCASAETPEEFSGRYLNALRTEGLTGAMKLTHPDEIKKLAGLIVELAALAVKNGESVPFIEKGDSVKQLRAQPPEQVAAKFFSWLGKVAPQLSSLLKTAEARTIGHLKDGDTVYVVTKLSMKMEGEIIESTDVLPLKKMGDSYGMLLKADMTQMLRGMKKQLEAAKEK